MIGSMKYMNGKPISEEQIDAWVAEAENGYDVATIKSLQDLHELRAAMAEDDGQRFTIQEILGELG